ncbi:MAG: LPD38 domain-containing protein [Thermoplasmata archaeon]
MSLLSELTNKSIRGITQPLEPISMLSKLTNEAIKPQTPQIFPLSFTNFGTQTTTPAFKIKPEPAKAVVPLVMSERVKQANVEALKAEKGAEKSYFLPALGQTTKEIGQSIARSFLATGATLEQVSRKGDVGVLEAYKTAIKTAEFKPETKFQEKLAGTKEPINFESIGQEMLSIGGEDFAKKHENLSLGIGLLVAGLDMTPFGGGKKQIFRLLKETDNVGDAMKLLLKLGVEDNLAREFAPDVVKVASEKEAKALFNSIANLQLKTKAVKPPISAISKELEPLTIEAKKYKTAEEFVKAQGKPVYRGGTALNIKEFDSKYGLSLSTDKEMALKFVKETGMERPRESGVLEEFILDPQAKIATIKDIPKDILKPHRLGLETQPLDTELVDWAKKNRFDAIDMRGIKAIGIDRVEKEIRVVNPNILKTKSQLTDIWNKAQVKVPSLLEKTEGILPKTKIGQITEELPPTVQPTKQPSTILPRAKEVLTQAEREIRGITQKELSLDKLYQKTGITTRIANESEIIIKDIPSNPTKWSRFTNKMGNFMTSFKEKVVNDWQRVKELSETKGLKLTGELTPYERRKLMAGRQTAQLQKTEEIIKKIDKDILDTSKKLKIKDTELQNEVFDYLKARHTPERNIALGEKAAGITTKEAKDIMARLENSPHSKEIKQIANDLQKFHNETLDILYQGGKPEGVISKELYDTLKTKYKNHIPLNRVMDFDDIGEVLSGRGLAVKGTGLKRAVGSEREVKDIMENIYTARTQAIQRVEKNIVDNDTFQFVQDYIKSFPEQELFKIVKPQAIGKTFEGKFILKQMNDPTILQFQRYGKPVYIKINDARLAVAFQGVNRERLPAVMRYISTVTRWMSALVTRYSPEFALSNKIRDMQEAVVYMASQDVGFKGVSKTAFRDPASINDVKNFVLGKETAGTKLYKQMIEDGGTTGGMALSTRKQVEATLDNIRSTNRNIARRGFKNLSESVDKWNTVFEDSTRLSAYKTALESGLSRGKAAIIAKNVSIDFNEFGTMGPIINALYMFSNASIQGSAKMIRAMRNPKVVAAVVGTVGAAVFAANEWNDSVDSEWRNKVSKWDKLNGLNIVIPGTEEFYYISIPVSWGLKPIKVAMEYGSDFVSGHKAEIGDMVEGLFVALMEGYNPMGGTDFASALTPSLIDPFIDIARNKLWTGSKLRPDWNKYAPASTQYFKDLQDSQTGKILINISQSVSEKTGGRIEFSPADAEYILQQITGGPGKFTGKVFNSISAIGKSELPEPRDIPFVSRLLRKTPEERFYTSKGENDIIKTLTEQERERFYDRQEAEKVFEELKKMPIEQRKETYKKLKEEKPRIIKRVDNIADEESKGLTKLDRQLLQLGVENGERAKYLFKVFKSAEPQERKELYQEYAKKGIISDNVKVQLDYLFANQ